VPVAAGRGRRGMRPGRHCAGTAFGTVPYLLIFRPLCKIFLAAPGLTQNFWWAIRVGLKILFWLRIVHFGLVWLWHVIRHFRIHLNFLQNFCVHSRPLQCLRPTRNYGSSGALNMALIWRGENMEFWKLAAAGKLAFALQAVIFYTPLHSPQFWDHTV